MKPHVALASIVLCAVAGCGPPKPPSLPLYKVGQMLRLKVDGAKVQCVGLWWNHFQDMYEYKCRVPGQQQNRRDGLLSKDTEIVRYMIIEFAEYELEPFPE